MEPTPQRAITEIAEELISIVPPSVHIMDAGAGTGALGKTLRKVLPRCKLLGIEKDPDAHKELWAWNKTTPPNLVYDMSQNSDVKDFRTVDVTGKFELFISRPPEQLITEFLDRLLLFSTFNNDCPVVLLLPFSKMMEQAPDWANYWSEKPLHGIRILTGHVLEGYAWFMFNAQGVKPMGWYKCQR